jgi:hypothetical protein
VLFFSFLLCINQVLLKEKYGVKLFPSLALRHAAAGFITAEHGFNRVRGYEQLAVLIAMLANQETGTLETVTA